MSKGEVISPRKGFNGDENGNDVQTVDAVRGQWQEHLSGNAKVAHFALRGFQALEELGFMPAALIPGENIVGIPVDIILIGLTTIFKTSVRVHGENNALKAAGLEKHQGGIGRIITQSLSTRGINPFSNR